MSINAHIKNKINGKKLVFGATSVVIVAVATFFVLFLLVKPASKSNNGYAGKVSIEKPSGSDPLQYQFISTKSSKGQIKFVYYTTESTDERLIAMNSHIISALKKAGKINNKTDNYSIDYYNDAEVAKTYQADMQNPSLSKLKRLVLTSKYIASMNYHKSMGVNSLLSISKAKIIKKY